jgi:hypothetical protein
VLRYPSALARVPGRLGRQAVPQIAGRDDGDEVRNRRSARRVEALRRRPVFERRIDDGVLDEIVRCPRKRPRPMSSGCSE